MSQFQKDLTKGSVAKQLVLFSLPFLASNLLQALYNMADMLIVGGTSLAVYPAAGLIRYFRGDDLVVINKQPTPADGMATLLVNKPIGQALSETEGEGEAICR